MMIRLRCIFPNLVIEITKYNNNYAEKKQIREWLSGCVGYAWEYKTKL